MAHAYSSVDETLEVYGCGLAYRLDLVERQGTLQDDTCEAAILEEFCTLRGHVAYLCRGVNLRREVHLSVGHVLDNKSVDTYLDKLTGKTLGVSELALVEYGVECDIYSHAKQVCVGNHTGDVVGGVCCSSACSEATRSDI